MRAQPAANVTRFVESDEHRQSSRATFEYNEAVAQVARILVGQKAGEAAAAWQSTHAGWHTNPQSQIEELPDNRKLLGAIWSLVGAGVLIPRLKNYNDVSVFLRITLTEKGERLVSNGDQHPLHPGFIKRFRATTPTTVDAVVAHLEDAVSCVEAGVLRPAVMMLGLANEVTIRVTHAGLAHQSKVRAAGAMAKVRDLLADILAVANGWTGAGAGSKDEQHRLVAACAAAEVIRDERNNAAHPGLKVDDSAHVESMMMAAAHHLPVFWEVIVKAAVAGGFAP